MKGKITKDIYLRVGSGMIRVPRTDNNGSALEPERFSPAKNADSSANEKKRSQKTRRA